MEAERNGSEWGKPAHDAALRFEALIATPGCLLCLLLDGFEPRVVGAFPPRLLLRGVLVPRWQRTRGACRPRMDGLRNLLLAPRQVEQSFHSQSLYAHPIHPSPH